MSEQIIPVDLPYWGADVPPHLGQQRIIYTADIIEYRRAEFLPGYQARVAARHKRCETRGVPWIWHSGVYFIEIGGFIKVGLAVDVRNRLRSYDCHSPFTPNPLGLIVCGSEADAMALEQAICERFAPHLLKRREWFHDAPEIRAYIARAAGPWPAPKPKRG